jgi:hypothetical protein
MYMSASSLGISPMAEHSNAKREKPTELAMLKSMAIIRYVIHVNPIISMLIYMGRYRKKSLINILR